MERLSLGSVVRLLHGSQPVMVLARGPLFNDAGTIGYFDYGACPYPNGYAGGDILFFNHEDVAEVLFEGYLDELEREYRRAYSEKIRDIKVPKLHLDYTGVDGGE